MTKERVIVLLCADGDSTRAIANALTDEFGPVKVILEHPVTRLQMAKRRAKKLGVLRVAGQVAFVGAVLPFLYRSGRRRIHEIERTHNMRKNWPDLEFHNVDSVNSDAARKILRGLDPDIVVVNGTRIISGQTIACTEAPFINMHAGITPLYRGVHGGYWALVEDNSQLVGTTVHFVDTGIDTGNIIDQVYFSVSKDDNFATYPYLHTAFGIPILIRAVREFFEGTLKTKPEGKGLGSRLRYHPTIWRYFFERVKKGIA